MRIGAIWPQKWFWSIKPFYFFRDNAGWSTASTKGEPGEFWWFVWFPAALELVPESKLGYVLAYIQGLIADVADVSEDTPNAKIIAAIQEINEMIRTGLDQYFKGSATDCSPYSTLTTMRILRTKQKYPKWASFPMKSAVIVANYSTFYTYFMFCIQ